MQSDGQTEPIPTADELRADYRALQAREFWERVCIASIEIAQRQASVTVPWSERCAEIADTALERWRERFEPKAGE